MSSMKLRGILHRMVRAFYRSRALWLTLGVTVLGVLLGLALSSPLMNLTVSVVSILVYLITIVANPLNGLLMWMVTSPFGDLYVNISLGHSLPDLSPTRFCVAFLCTLLLAQAALRIRYLAPFTPVDAAGVVFMFGLGLSAINEDSGLQVGLQGVFDDYYVPLLVYFFAKNLVKRRQDVDKVLGAVLFFGVYAGLYAIYENQTENILFFKGSAHFTRYGDSGLHVLRGLLHRSDHFGALFSMVTPLAFYLYLKASTRTRKGLYAIALVILVIGIYVTYKRTAWISIAVNLFVLQWFYPRFRRLFLALLLVFLVVLGATWNTVSQSVVVTDRINSKVSTTEGRTDGWNAAINLWADQPLFGYGHGNYASVARRRGIKDAALECEHLSVLFGSGLAGFLPYIAWYVLILWDSVRLYRASGRNNGGDKPYVDRELMIVFWSGWLGYIINYTTATAGVFPVTMVFYLLMGALVGSQARFLVSSHQDSRSAEYCRP